MPACLIPISIEGSFLKRRPSPSPYSRFVIPHTLPNQCHVTFISRIKLPCGLDLLKPLALFPFLFLLFLLSFPSLATLPKRREKCTQFCDWKRRPRQAGGMTRAMLWLMGLMIRWSLDLSQCLGDALMPTYLSCILWMTDDQMSRDSRLSYCLVSESCVNRISQASSHPSLRDVSEWSFPCA